MEYTVGELGKLAGISTRTLRYYDRIGLLKPSGATAAGYRIYGPAEVDKLHHILLYRELGLDLETIRAIVTSPEFDGAKALREHRGNLLAERRRLDALIANVEKAIDAMEGRIAMSDAEKFEGFKRALIEENEKKYGKEAREKYGNEAVDRSNAKLLGLTEKEYRELTALEAQMRETLKAAMKAGDPAGELAQKAADLHRRWLTFFWNEYTKEAHAGVAQMYVDDPRFAAYYDKEQPGTAAFLRDAVLVYTGQNPR